MESTKRKNKRISAECRAGRPVWQDARKVGPFAQYVGYAVIGAISYGMAICCLYVVAAILLSRGWVAEIDPMQSFQRNFYFSTSMSVWQGLKECVDFDEVLIYKPKVGQCRFVNPEFDTILTFDQEGRVAPGESSPMGAIAVVGDSHAMGWGVGDSETFSAVLQRESGRRVYNLAVASYGTRRELLRLEASGLVSKVDTVVVQYCDNDLSENINFRPVDIAAAREKFDGASSFWRSGVLGKVLTVGEGVARSLGGPLLALKRSVLADPDFAPHYEQLVRVLSEFPALRTKRVIVFYSNSYGKQYRNFPKGRDQQLQNVFFADLNVPPEEYFQVDGHLAKAGHNTLGKQLKALVSSVP